MESESKLYDDEEIVLGGVFADWTVTDDDAGNESDTVEDTTDDEESSLVEITEDKVELEIGLIEAEPVKLRTRYVEKIPQTREPVEEVWTTEADGTKDEVDLHEVIQFIQGHHRERKQIWFRSGGCSFSLKTGFSPENGFCLEN